MREREACRNTPESVERSGHSLTSLASTARVTRRLVTGWGNTVTVWAAHLTVHAVDVTRAGDEVAVCGVQLFDLNPSRPWTGAGDGDAGACRRCSEIAWLCALWSVD